MRALRVLYEDNHLLCVDKPAGLPTQPSSKGGPSVLEAAKEYIRKKYNKPGNVYLGIVHRLDQPVSGVLLFARTSKAAKRLSAGFRERNVRKVYFAVVEGRVEPAAAVLGTHLYRDEKKCITIVSSEEVPGSKRAELYYEVVDTRRSYSLLEIEMATGRKHQIRAQLADLGHPVVGDNRYGATARLKHGAIALHSRFLEVPHPTKDKTMEFEAKPPSYYPWDLFSR